MSHTNVVFVPHLVNWDLVTLVVDQNRSLFEINADVLDDVQNSIEDEGVLEDAWSELCPEQELERLECREELKEQKQGLEDHVDKIPDLTLAKQQDAHLEKK